MNSRQRAKRACQDIKPIFAAVHYRARLRYGRAFVKKDILLTQKSAIQVNELRQKFKATARRQEPPQRVDADGIRILNNALWFPVFCRPTQ
jgi:hypothetical protein